jgi:hypothetical protein
MEKHMCGMIQSYVDQCTKHGDLMDHHLDELTIMLNERAKVYRAFGKMMDRYKYATECEMDAEELFAVK